jgi:hypothetical protein
MNITDLCKMLEPFGWRFDGTSLHSPSGGYWVTESMMESPAQVYQPVARRREMALRDGYPEVQEYDALLRALQADPSISILASRVRVLGEIVTAWATAHGATVTLWDFSLPAARATARHPFGGIACIDCQLEETAVVSVTPLHWCDDHSNGIRRSWRQSLSPCDLFAAPLTARLDEAVSLILEARDITSYKETERAAGAVTAATVALTKAWEDGFDILH